MEISPDADGFIKVSPRSAQRSMVVANKTPVTTSNNFELLQVHTSDQETTEGNKIVLSTEFSPSSSASVTRKQKKRKLRNSPVSGGILSLGWKDDHSNN
ncbi:BnaA01g17920D [Brassica napus]|uniref:BnaA01g17920D protein n=2 Tax=Brassica TaxID=3705 RepID=A0A078HYJ2_BRANA|nr:BnaA01g17920D [Brassica napus]